MNKKEIIEALGKLKETKERKFVQSYDLIINLKNIDLKKTPIDFFITLPHKIGKKVKICALVAQELSEQAEAECDKKISDNEFEKYQKDKNAVKKLASECDFFIAQANLMAKIATVFGKILGPKGKMPNPKAGCIVPPQAQLKPVVDKIQRTIRVSAKKQLNMMCRVGTESMKEEYLAENILSALTTTIRTLPSESNNIKNILLKKTMSKPVELKW